MGARGMMVAGLICLLPAAADARLAVSANDGKQLQAGEQTGVTPDGISVIDVRSLADNGAVAEWLDRRGVSAVLVRPDHYVFGTANDSAALVAALRQSLGQNIRESAHAHA